MMETARELLQKHYGYSDFRSGQESILRSVLAGHDTLGIMPTGGGKSICYQIPALLLPGLTLVISPLISLMKDQVDALQSLGIPAAMLNSTLSAREADDTLAAAKQGAFKLLYIAPERLDSERFRNDLYDLPISQIAIDEAHCISQWGHDFRPSYLSVSRMIQTLPVRPLITAFTATATPEVTQDILSLLSIRPDHVFVTGFNRENLSFALLRGVNKRDYLDAFLPAHKDEAGIIYAATRKEVDQLHEILNARGYTVGKYHAGLTDDEKAMWQEKFLYDDVRIMVATNAFGMGIDKSNVRWILHYNMPKNMESYYQEAGRAGRDGGPGQCVLLYHPQDVQLQKFLIEQSSAQERQANEYKKLQAMVDFCHTTRCLRNYILEYFEDVLPEPCGVCSSCVDDSELRDITVEAQKIFSCIKRMKERFGAGLVAQTLKGSSNQKVKQFGFDRLPTYGIMKEYKEKDIADLIHLLVAEGYLALTDSRFPTVHLTQRAVGVLQGHETVQQKVRAKQEAERQGTPDADLFERLREVRKEISQREKVPPYIIFADSTLREMSEYVPADEAAMLRIKGVGESKFAKYGAPFLDAIRSYAEERGLDLSERTQPAGDAAERPAADNGKGDTPTHLQSLALFQAGRSVREIAAERGLKPVTIEDHLIRSAVEGHDLDWSQIIPAEHEPLILAAADEIGAEKLRPLKDALPPEVEYFTIKAVLAKRGM